jgi:4-amino-4-deoxy-L-arabinose transferase-like glycosyltransferase
VAPSLVGQIWLTLPFVKLFGFSHTLLRACTAVVSVMLVWLVDRILAVAGTGVRARVLTGVLLIGNPIFLHLAFSYMTEPYGYAIALAGGLVWLRARARHVGGATGRRCDAASRWCRERLRGSPRSSWRTFCGHDSQARTRRHSISAFYPWPTSVRN